VAVCGRREGPLAETVELLRAAGAAEARAATCDVRYDDDVATMAARSTGLGGVRRRREQRRRKLRLPGGEALPERLAPVIEIVLNGTFFVSRAFGAG